MQMTDGATPRPRVILAVLALACAGYAMLQSLVVPALPTLQHDLDTTPAGVTWVFTAYLLSASVATPIAGRLGDMFGKKRTLLVVMSGLAGGSLIAALATTLPVLIAARAIQGIGGAMFPLAFGIIRDEFPRERVAGGIALISGLLGIGGGLGIVLAGPIIDNLGYHWLFWIPCVVIGATVVATMFLIPESPIRAPGSVDWLGASLLSCWLVCLLLGISEAPQWGWASTRTIGLLWYRGRDRSRVDRRREPADERARRHADDAAASGLVDEPRRVPDRIRPVQRLRAHPSVRPDSAVERLRLRFVRDRVRPVPRPVDADDAGRRSVQRPALEDLWTQGAARPRRRAHDARVRVPCNRAFHHWQFYAASVLLGIGVGFAFASLANLIVESVRPDQTGVATGMNAVMRTIGGAIGGQVAATLLAASLLADGYPSEHGYTVTFAVMAGVLAASVAASLAVPGRRPHRAHLVTLTEPQRSLE